MLVKYYKTSMNLAESKIAMKELAITNFHVKQVPVN